MLKYWFTQKGGSYVVVQFILFAVIWLAPSKLFAQSWNTLWTQVGTWAGVLLMSYGAVALLGGLLQLGRQIQAVPMPKETATLRQSGVYGLVRHPIYSGIIFGWFGWGIFNQAELTALLVLGLLLPFFDIKTRREEKMLTSHFAAYGDYQANVRKLIPFVY